MLGRLSLIIATAVLAVAITLAAPAAPALAGVTVRVDLSDQRMRVYVNGARSHSWAVSTGRRNYRTPTGSYRPTRMYRRYFSIKYDGAPMPYSIFFRGGYAIHGTNHVSALGRPASHGCIRLRTEHARRLYDLVRRHGPGNTRIVIRH